MYAILTKKGKKTKTYCEVVMLVSAQILREWANEIPEKVMDKNGTGYKVSVVPATIFAMQFFTDTRYLPAADTLKS